MQDFTEVTYGQHQVVCEHPQVVLSPLVPELLARYGVGVFNGHFFSYNSFQRKKLMSQFPYGEFSARRNHIDRSNMDQSYVLDPSTGEQFPMYIEVPCNHCAICKDRKRQSMVQRAKLETLYHGTHPWFVTLTYAPKYLPKKGLSKRDCALFMKRFRINLERSGYKPKIRCMYCGEYGPNGTRRPHYHYVIWNLPGKDVQAYVDVSACLEKSWKMGIVESRITDIRDERDIYYTTKYLDKGVDTPKGKNPTFFHSSNGNGGIGLPWIQQHSAEILGKMNTKYKYYNPYSGKITDLVFDQYVLNHLVPSYCKSVPSQFRSNLQEFSRLLNSPIKCENLDFFRSKYNEYCVKYFHEVFNPYHGGTPAVCSIYDEKETKMPLEKYLNSLVKQIDRVGTKVDFAEAHSLADKRNLFLYKLFRYSTPVDISERAYRARRRYGKSMSTKVV